MRWVPMGRKDERPDRVGVLPAGSTPRGSLKGARETVSKNRVSDKPQARVWFSCEAEISKAHRSGWMLRSLPLS